MNAKIPLMSDLSDCFQTEYIPIQQFLSLSNVLADYLNKEPKLQPFVSTYPDVNELGENIQQRINFNTNREILSKALYKQNIGFQLHRNQSESLEMIKSGITFCITTAHQTNLFGGPLYFIQKAVSTIKACQIAKQQYPDYFFVPIYWLGSEDHDFDELNHTWMNGERVQWNDEQGGAVGRYSTKSLETVIDEVEQILGNSERARYISGLFRRAYQQKESVAKATRLLLNELLGEYGLLVVDGDDKELKKLMIPFFEREIKEQFSYKASKISTDFLETEYGSYQAHPREINLFYLTENKRNRILKKENGYEVEETELFFSTEEMIDELEDHPERFSPNVILRPLMQEICLPNILYVGGGGETSYWFQLKPVFDEANCPYPMIGLRDSSVYLSKKMLKKIDQLNLKITDFFQPKHQLSEKLIETVSNQQLILEEPRKLIKEAMMLMEQQAEEIDYTLKDSAKAERQRMMNALNNLEKKMLRAEKKNHEIALQRMQTVYETIYPGGSLQERRENFSSYYIAYGKDWIRWMVKNYNLFDQQLKIMKSHC